MNRLEGRTAIVTGAAQGIGAAYARALAGEGVRVVIADILDGQAVADEITRAGGEALNQTTDVADPESCEAMVAATIERFGTLDILVTNAALFGTLERKRFEDIDIAEWDRVIDVNVTGPFLCVRAAAPVMRKQGGGKIINVSSSTVMKGTPNMMHYVTSKGAIIAFTRALARELGDDGICVNAIAPGLTMSENLVARADVIAPFLEASIKAAAFKREQLPEDLIGVLIYLASADSDFVTGQTIVVDGGGIMY